MDEAVMARIARLEAIAASVRERGDGLGLLALGSAADTARMDRWSDLDFFVIVRPGAKFRLIEDLGWLSAAAPLAYAFRNTVDGWKALFADGIFAEFAVFEPAELAGIPFAPGRLVWRHPDLDPALCVPAPRAPSSPSTVEWIVGEALTNILIGLGRWRRGERTSGFRFIQSHAVDRVIQLADLGLTGEAGRDPFGAERRVEARHPDLAAALSAMMPGVERCPEAARAILGWIEARYPVNPAIRAAILDLA